MNKVRTASEQSEHVYNQGLTEGYVNYVFTHQHGARGWHGVNVVNEVGAVERGGRDQTQLDAVELSGLDTHSTNPTHPVSPRFTK